MYIFINFYLRTPVKYRLQYIYVVVQGAFTISCGTEQLVTDVRSTVLVGNE